MKREFGHPSFSIWILGDSEPKNWKDVLDYPFDDRHPIVHNIWTSIIDKIQFHLYMYDKSRLDSKKVFIRNAVDRVELKPDENLKDWNQLKELNDNILEYSNLIKDNKPKIIFTFGAFAYEFAKRSTNTSNNNAYNYWTTERLGKEFNSNIKKPKPIKIIPLLHRSIAGGYFLSGHKNFCGSDKANYFEYVAERIFEEIKDYSEIKIKL